MGKKPTVDPSKSATADTFLKIALHLRLLFLRNNFKSVIAPKL